MKKITVLVILAIITIASYSQPGPGNGELHIRGVYDSSGNKIKNPNIQLLELNSRETSFEKVKSLRKVRLTVNDKNQIIEDTSYNNYIDKVIYFESNYRNDITNRLIVFHKKDRMVIDFEVNLWLIIYYGVGDVPAK